LANLSIRKLDDETCNRLRHRGGPADPEASRRIAGAAGWSVLEGLRPREGCGPGAFSSRATWAHGLRAIAPAEQDGALLFLTPRAGEGPSSAGQRPAELRPC